MGRKLTCILRQTLLDLSDDLLKVNVTNEARNLKDYLIKTNKNDIEKAFRQDVTDKDKGGVTYFKDCDLSPVLKDEKIGKDYIQILQLFRPTLTTEINQMARQNASSSNSNTTTMTTTETETATTAPADSLFQSPQLKDLAAKIQGELPENASMQDLMKAAIGNVQNLVSDPSIDLMSLQNDVMGALSNTGVDPNLITQMMSTMASPQ